MLWTFYFCATVTVFLTGVNFCFTCGDGQGITNLQTELQAVKTLVEQLVRRQHIPVFHVRSSEGRYKLSFNQAEQMCIEHGAKIATTNQICAAWDDGLNVCEWGWVSDQKVYLPIRYPRPGCGSRRELLSLQKNVDFKSDVYCFKY